MLKRYSIGRLYLSFVNEHLLYHIRTVEGSNSGYYPLTDSNLEIRYFFGANISTMLKNYFTIAWRNLKHHKSFAFINIFGLSLGIACAILIFTLITYHLSFDKFHPDADRIYRIVSEFHYDNIEYQQGVPQPLGKAFRNDFSFAEKTARVRAYHDVTISTPEEKDAKKFEETDMLAFAEPEFFDIFHFPLLEGDKETILREPGTAIVTQGIAEKYFGSSPAIGKILRINSLNHTVDFKISGILKNIPFNTDRKQQIYLSYENLKDYDNWYASDKSWGSTTSGMQFFIKLKPGIDKSSVEKALKPFVKKYFDGDDANTTVLKLQPLSDIHFNTNFGGQADRKFLWALALIGFFLIVIASVNFVNLATAQAFNRSKEVGVRKVLGGRQLHLFSQFMAETTLITSFAVILAYGIANFALPYLNELFKGNLTIQLFQQWELPAFIISLTIVVTFLSGFYPGLVIARFRPALALKGKLSQKSIGGVSLRRSLIVIQFAISQILIIGMIIIAGQIHYSKTSDLGFNKDAIVMLPIPSTDLTKLKTFRNQLTSVAGVEKTSLCTQAPASTGKSFTSVRYGNHSKDEQWEILLKDADDQYVSTFGLKLVAGRNFFPSDTITEFLVNETVVKKLGFGSPQEVIGNKLSINGGTLNARISGVVKDFYNNSFREGISPIVIMSNHERFRFCAVKVNMAHAQTAIGALRKIWNESFPDNVFAYYFLDERIASFYEQDNIALTLTELFAAIAILIACLGLYGLVSFMAVQKTKEIGIRKVLGASIQNILWLFGKEFALLLLLAFAIAAPLGGFTMKRWLQGFTYRIQISPAVFLISIAGTFVIAALTISYITLKSATANPVKSLKAE